MRKLPRKDIRDHFSLQESSPSNMLFNQNASLISLYFREEQVIRDGDDAYDISCHLQFA